MRILLFVLCVFLACLTLLPKFDAEQALSIIANDRVTFFLGVPTMYMGLLAAKDRKRFDTSSLTVSGHLDNNGREPVVTHGTLAVLRSSGQLIGRVAIESHRLLPGEKFDCAAEYPHNLSPGRYRAMMSLDYEGGVLTRSVEFDVP